jgi:hypothetical protein
VVFLLFHSITCNDLSFFLFRATKISLSLYQKIQGPTTQMIQHKTKKKKDHAFKAEVWLCNKAMVNSAKTNAILVDNNTIETENTKHTKHDTVSLIVIVS